MQSVLLAGAVSCAFAILPSTGCPMRGCDPAQSFTSGSVIPSRLQSTHLLLAVANATDSPGCIASLGRAACAVPLARDPAATTWSGIVAVNQSTGDLIAMVWQYSLAGSVHCSALAPAASAHPYFSSASLPLMNAAEGDIITWDASSFVRLDGRDGAVQWAREVSPTVPMCPVSLPSLSLTNQSDVIYTLPGIGEIGAYISDGVPQSYIDLVGNDTGTEIFPPPPPPGRPQRSAGLLVPLSQPLVDGARVIHVARFFNATDAAPPLLTATPSLYLIAVDQRNAAVDRMHFAYQWQFPLPAELHACAPSTGAPPVPIADVSADPLLVAGPMAMFVEPGRSPPAGASFGGTALVALSCPPSPSQHRGGGAASAATATHIFAVTVNDSPAASYTSRASAAGPPSLLWHVAVEPPIGGGGVVQIVAGPAASHQVWLAFAGSDIIMLLNASSGAVVGELNTTRALRRALPGAGCDGAATATPSGPLITSAPGAGSPAGASALILVPFVAAPDAAAWIAAIAVTADGGAVAMWCAPVPGGGRITGQAVVVPHSNGNRSSILAVAGAGIVAFECN